MNHEHPFPAPQEPKHRSSVLLDPQEKTDAAKVLGFIGVLVLIGFVGLLFFLRPLNSDSDGAESATFPAFSLSALADGSFFSDIATWYGATFPGRDGLRAVQDGLESLYGFRNEQKTSERSDRSAPEPDPPLSDESDSMESENGRSARAVAPFFLFLHCVENDKDFKR